MTTPQGMLELADELDNWPAATVVWNAATVSALMKKASIAFRQAAAPQGREADAWQWRACISGKWGAWLYLDHPIARFKGRNAFNLDNGTYELRPLFALTPAVAGAVESDLCQCPKCGRMHRGLGAGKPPAIISGEPT